jgi:hypothetical protein
MTEFLMIFMIVYMGGSMFLGLLEYVMDRKND